MNNKQATPLIGLVIVVILLIIATMMGLNQTNVNTPTALELDFYKNSTPVASEGGLNNIEGVGIDITMVDDPANNQVDSTFDVTAGYRLPQTCTNTQLATWNLVSGIWECVNRVPEQLASPFSEYWTIPGWWVAFETTNAGITADLMWFTPILVISDNTYDRIGIEVTAAGASVGSLARLCIYNSQNSGSGIAPGSLVVDAGTVAVGSADGTGTKILTISETLQQGYYFLAYLSDDVPTLRVPNNSGAIDVPVEGMSSSAGPLMNNVILRTTSVPAQVAGGCADPASPVTGASTSSFASVFLRRQ